jgi:hypothetical protein
LLFQTLSDTQRRKNPVNLQAGGVSTEILDFLYKYIPRPPNPLTPLTLQATSDISRVIELDVAGIPKG